MKFLILVWATDKELDLSPDDMQFNLLATLDFIGQLKRDQHFVDGSTLNHQQIVRVENGSKLNALFSEHSKRLSSYYLMNARDLKTALSITQKDPRINLGYSLDVCPIITLTDS